MRFHFAGSAVDTKTLKDHVPTRTALRDAFAAYLASPDDPTRTYVAGQLLHLMADTFSHDGYTAWYSPSINCLAALDSVQVIVCTGHSNAAEGGHAPDRPYNKVEEALDAAGAIYTLAPTPPGGTVRPWPALRDALRTAMTPSTAAVELRVLRMQELIKEQFGEDARYSKDVFKQERRAFNAAVDASVFASKWPWASGK
jgi:hypothetical protein